jgi:flagellar hook-basal body complex protein FliE
MDSVRLNIAEIPGAAAPERAELPNTRGTSFSGELGKAISEVDKLHVEADTEANKLAQGKGNLHETALALEKADIGLKLLTKVRNKVVEAYQEVMRMSV